MYSLLHSNFLGPLYLTLTVFLSFFAFVKIVVLFPASRDSLLCLWRVNEDGCGDAVSPERSLQLPEYDIMAPLSKITCPGADKFRALAFNVNLSELAAVSLNGFVHIWDAQRFKSVYLQFQEKSPL